MNNISIDICFIANFYKTFLFHELAKKLMPNGVNIFWIVTKSEQYDFLKKHYSDSTILYINRTFIDKPNTLVDEFRLNELVYGDRVFKHEIENGLKFLANIQVPLYDFLLKNKIRFVFSEITWAHELLVLRMTKKRVELNCTFLNLALIRIPNNRIAFFTDENQNNMREFDGQTNSEIIKLEKPSYLKINDKIMEKRKSLKGRLNRLKRFFTGENIEKNDPNVITNKFIRFKVAAREEINKSTYTYLKRVGLEEIEKEKFIFFGFHKQPEASIDVMGRYYENQDMDVINLWRQLPWGWKLVIKEHTNAIGDRSIGFYKKLLDYPNILLADEKIDSRLLIEKSKLVASVTGTIAYEAALLKKPAITFSKMFFNKINYCRYVTIHDLLKYESLKSFIDELNSQEDNRFEFSNYLMKNTVEGYINDPVTDPKVLEEKNLEVLCSAFMKLINFKN